MENSDIVITEEQKEILVRRYGEMSSELIRSHRDGYDVWAYLLTKGSQDWAVGVMREIVKPNAVLGRVNSVLFEEEMLDAIIFSYFHVSRRIKGGVSPIMLKCPRCCLQTLMLNDFGFLYCYSHFGYYSPLGLICIKHGFVKRIVLRVVDYFKTKAYHTLSLEDYLKALEERLNQRRVQTSEKVKAVCLENQESVTRQEVLF